jgi:hypothetical protein
MYNSFCIKSIESDEGEKNNIYNFKNTSGYDCGRVCGIQGSGNYKIEQRCSLQAKVFIKKKKLFALLLLVFGLKVQLRVLVAARFKVVSKPLTLELHHHLKIYLKKKKV